MTKCNQATLDTHCMEGVNLIQVKYIHNTIHMQNTCEGSNIKRPQAELGQTSFGRLKCFQMFNWLPIRSWFISSSSCLATSKMSDQLFGFSLAERKDESPDVYIKSEKIELETPRQNYE